MAIKTAERKEIDAIFDKIDEIAMSGKFDTTIFENDDVCRLYYRMLKILYKGERIGLIDYKKLEESKESDKNRFFEEFRKARLHRDVVSQDQERYKTGTTVLYEILNTCDTITKDEFIRATVPLFKIYFNKPAGNIIEQKLKMRGWI